MRSPNVRTLRGARLVDTTWRTLVLEKTRYQSGPAVVGIRGPMRICPTPLVKFRVKKPLSICPVTIGPRSRVQEAKDILRKKNLVRKTGAFFDEFVHAMVLGIVAWRAGTIFRLWERPSRDGPLVNVSIDTVDINVP